MFRKEFMEQALFGRLGEGVGRERFVMAAAGSARWHV